jgi:hypothetical protein
MNNGLVNPTLSSIEDTARNAEAVLTLRKPAVQVNRVRPSGKGQEKRTNSTKNARNDKQDTKDSHEKPIYKQNDNQATKETQDFIDTEKPIWSADKIKLYEEKRCFKCSKLGQRSRDCPNVTIKRIVPTTEQSSDVDSDKETVWYEERYYNNSNSLVSSEHRSSVKASRIRVASSLTNKKSSIKNQLPSTIPSHSKNKKRVSWATNITILEYDRTDFIIFNDLNNGCTVCPKKI